LGAFSPIPLHIILGTGMLRIEGTVEGVSLSTGDDDEEEDGSE